MHATSNPALATNALEAALGSMQDASLAQTRCSVGGIATKTAIFLGVAAAVGGVGYSIVQANPQWMLWINLTAVAVTLGVFFAIRARPAIAAGLGFVYAAAQGFLLGGVASLLDGILVQQGIQILGGVALSAALITLMVTVAMLSLYAFRIVRPSRGLSMAIGGATLAIMLLYLAAFATSWLAPSWAGAFKFITLKSAMEGGSSAWIGLGINVLILIVAAMTLVPDFGAIEESVAAGAPKGAEWYLAFGLLVSIAWIYFEALRLAFRLALLFSNRE
jgi:uncharacterized YccA/Bax inhibitor family protein